MSGKQVPALELEGFFPKTMSCYEGETEKSKGYKCGNGKFHGCQTGLLFWTQNHTKSCGKPFRKAKMEKWVYLRRVLPKRYENCGQVFSSSYLHCRWIKIETTSARQVVLGRRFGLALKVS